jgi:hypothetical protein
MNLLMGENYEDSTSLESHKESCQQHSDVTIMYNNKYSEGTTIGILVVTLRNSSYHRPPHQVTTISQ